LSKDLAALGLFGALAFAEAAGFLAFTVVFDFDFSIFLKNFRFIS
jgi:hypothetical protein